MALGLTLTLRFETQRELLDWYAEFVAAGSVFIPAQEYAHPGSEIWLRIMVPQVPPFLVQGRVREREVAPAGLRVMLEQVPALRELLTLRALDARQGRLNAPEGGRRRHPRFDTCLRARFRNQHHLREEYVTNISRGGMFIRTTAPLSLGDQIGVLVTLPNEEEYEVLATVVRVGPEPGTASAGVGVAFAEETQGFSSAIEKLLEGYQKRPPHLMVVEDNGLFRRMMADALTERGMFVTEASNGFQAVHLLKEHLYELDGVVVDLNMPGMDGVGLIGRIRRLKSEMDLRVVLVTASSLEELRHLVRPELADEALEKGVPIEALAERIHQVVVRR